ncbi:hypothetical protein BO86DRAFT_393971 [Aspergillus japonicus CBS 114.51]|uniref:Uncharacterized protein n=3 Tax=Aspergillus TaxID=5052 RepID=A0A2V5GY08_ASPV1|nr:hypothetical protein BO86DRAFT_393971 [Aspergillus japonicus CBS 114.51]PYI14202.1 hypothetical protein BO99DRAFT_447083 [Aspergillus violaceofuscus CBS 115571]PYI28372.1 hypothetical protein BP00DRAFT_428432 [Aspergillus indologenus CBS 114.80]RAH75803.1 hypothetical protein BO86DRAFT_393971 [Aspergillus japonicus CBS 114.51]
MQLTTLLLATATLLASTVSAQSKPHGIDIGNEACVGSCVRNPKLLTCPKTKYQPDQGCYVCCWGDDDADAWADHIHDDFGDF